MTQLVKFCEAYPEYINSSLYLAGDGFADKLVLVAANAIKEFNSDA